MAIPEKKWEPLLKYKGHHHRGNKLIKRNFLERQGFVGFTFELVVKDENEMKIDKFIWNTKKKFEQILSILIAKYGMG